MALTIQHMLDQNLFDGMHAVAGLGGLSNEVTWINVMEILDTPGSVKEGELLITTGYQLDHQELHSDLIPILHAHHVAGMVIQSGYYIDRIPTWLIETANLFNFPILELPSEYTFSDILHRTITAITQDKKDYSRSHLDCDYFLPLLKSEVGRLHTTLTLTDYGIPLLLASSVKGNVTDQALSEIHDQISSYLGGCGKIIHFRLPDESQAVWYLFPGQDVEYPTIVYDIQQLLETLSSSNSCTVYMGSARCSLSDKLSDSLLVVMKCITLLNDIHALRGICPSNQYPMVQLIGKIHQFQGSETFVHPALRILSRKDESGHYDYVRTLKIFLAENCNMTHTAGRLYLHRHTLINRIAAITDLCGIDLDDYYTRSHLSLSLLMHDYYG